LLNPVKCLVEGGYPVHVPQRNMLVRRIDYRHHRLADDPSVLDLPRRAGCTAVLRQVGQNDIAPADSKSANGVYLSSYLHRIAGQRQKESMGRAVGMVSPNTQFIDHTLPPTKAAIRRRVDRTRQENQHRRSSLSSFSSNLIDERLHHALLILEQSVHALIDRAVSNQMVITYAPTLAAPVHPATALM